MYSSVERLIRVSEQARVNANQSGCCGGRVKDQKSPEQQEEETPPHMKAKPTKLKPESTQTTTTTTADPDAGIDKRTLLRTGDEDAEARKMRLTGGALSKSLLNDGNMEPLPPRIRRPGEPSFLEWKPPPPPPKMGPMPARGANYNRELEKHLNHLPFFTQNRYNHVALVRKLKKIKPLRDILKSGRYFIDKDRKILYDPRMDPRKLQVYLRNQEKRAALCRAEGREYRIVDLFMDKVLGWGTTQEMLPPASSIRGSSFCFLWLGPHLAKKMVNQLCAPKEPTPLFEAVKKKRNEGEFYMINRLPVDIFFKDKEAFYGMLSQYIMNPKLVCKNRPIDEQLYLMTPKDDCHEQEEKGLVTRSACVHQNLSLSLKPCSVSCCRNYKKPVCCHMYAFIPETITLTSYTSMLHFSERFQRVEDLRGCIFITKPAYLCNGRGIKFIVTMDQFDYFFHMLDGKATSRHGVVLQRYIECPRLFDRQKFTIRFFLHIVVLEKRRVIGFIHYGIALFARLPYEPVKREDFDPEEEVNEGKKPNLQVPIEQRTIGNVVTEKFVNEMHLTNYLSAERKAKIREAIFTGNARMLHEDEDNAFYLEDILPEKCDNTTSIYVQMLFVAQTIMDYLQPIVQDYAGTFQTIAIDSLVDARNKLWILEANTNIFTGLLSIAPRQRQMMSAILQETIGITIESFYKSRKGLPLYWDYENNKEDYDAFYFSQDFNFFYETEICRQSGYIFAKRPPTRELLLEQRYRQVDDMRDAAAERRQANLNKKKQVIRDRELYKLMVKAKNEEES